MENSWGNICPNACAWSIEIESFLVIVVVVVSGGGADPSPRTLI